MFSIANAQVWVHDQDEALDFYTTKLGMEVRADVTLPEMGKCCPRIVPTGSTPASATRRVTTSA